MKELHVVPHKENKGLPLFEKPNACVLVSLLIVPLVILSLMFSKDYLPLVRNKNFPFMHPVLPNVHLHNIYMSKPARWKAYGKHINTYDISLSMLHLHTLFLGSYIVCLRLSVLFLPKLSISLPVTSFKHPKGFQLSNMLHFLNLLCS